MIQKNLSDSTGVTPLRYCNRLVSLNDTLAQPPVNCCSIKVVPENLALAIQGLNDKASN